MENFHCPFPPGKMPNNFIKCFAWMFIFVLAVGFACAAGEWGDINSGVGGRESVVGEGGINDSGDDVALAVINNSDDSVGGGEILVATNDFVVDSSGGSGGERYTVNFYIALGIGVIALAIVAYFIYLFFREPRNRWK